MPITIARIYDNFFMHDDTHIILTRRKFVTSQECNLCVCGFSYFFQALKLKFNVLLHYITFCAHVKVFCFHSKSVSKKRQRMKKSILFIKHSRHMCIHWFLRKSTSIWVSIDETKKICKIKTLIRVFFVRIFFSSSFCLYWNRCWSDVQF